MPFENGASVSRIWGDAEEAELLAAFQYSTDAEDFARFKLTQDVERSFKESVYAVACHYSGKLKVVRQKREAEQVPA